MIEQWRAVVGYEGIYEVSDHGQVKSLARTRKGFKGSTVPVVERMLSQISVKGYRKVGLSRDGKTRLVSVHRLVAQAFIAGDGPMVLHGDGNRANNIVNNLRWGDGYANMADMLTHGHSVHANKTHCKRGHEYDEANTYLQPQSSKTGRVGRVCRTCHRERKRRQRVGHSGGSGASEAI